MLACRLEQRHDAVVLLGNGVEDALRTGDWPWAIAELGAAVADELQVADRAILLQTAVFIDAALGDPVAGQLDEMTRVLGPATDLTLRTTLELAAAFASFAAGLYADARQAWHRVATLSEPNPPDVLARAARAALSTGNASGAADGLAALDAAGVHGPAMDADRWSSGRDARPSTAGRPTRSPRIATPSGHGATLGLPGTKH